MENTRPGLREAEKLAVISETKEEDAMTETFGEKEEKSKTPPAKELRNVKFTGETAAARPVRGIHGRLR